MTTQSNPLPTKTRLNSPGSYRRKIAVPVGVTFVVAASLAAGIGIWSGKQIIKLQHEARYAHVLEAEHQDHQNTREQQRRVIQGAKDFFQSFLVDYADAQKDPIKYDELADKFTKDAQISAWNLSTNRTTHDADPARAATIKELKEIASQTPKEVLHYFANNPHSVIVKDAKSMLSTDRIIEVIFELNGKNLDCSFFRFGVETETNTPQFQINQPPSLVFSQLPQCEIPSNSSSQSPSPTAATPIQHPTTSQTPPRFTGTAVAIQGQGWKVTTTTPGTRPALSQRIGSR